MRLLAIKRGLLYSGLLLALSSFANVYAATIDARIDEEAEGEAGSLEEVVVTARKYEESLMEIPVAVTAFTERDIELRNIQNLQDVALYTPGLAYFDSVQNQLGVATIRGITQTNLNSPDRNVAIFYGGVYLSNSNASNLEMLDLERIEVVKGPQSALYGRNAFMGAINYVPARPTDKLMIYAEGIAGSYERFEGRVKASGPIGENFGWRLAASRDTFDGTWKNIGDPDDNLGGYDTTNVSGMLTFNAGGFNAQLFGYYTDDRRDSTPQYFVDLNCGPTPAYNTVYCGTFPIQQKIGVSPDALAFSREVKLAALDLAYDFGPVTLSGQFSWYKAKTDNYSDYQSGSHDGNGSTFNIVKRFTTDVIRQQQVQYYSGQGKGDSNSNSQEIRLQSSQDQRFRWMVGAFRFDSEATTFSNWAFDGTDLATDEIPVDAFFGLAYLVTVYDDPRHNMVTLGNDLRKDKQTAYFGSIDFDVTETLTLGAELRHDKEDRSLQSLLRGPSSLQEGSFDYNTWRFSADYKVADEHMIYASAAKGVISGFFNGTFDSAAQKPVPVELQYYYPAENITYELGWKGVWLDNRLSTELTVFYIDYKDIQINANPPADSGLITNLIQNIGDVTGKGVELSVNYAPSINWTMGMTYSYTPTKFDDGTPDSSMSRYCGGTSGMLMGFCPSVLYEGVLQPDIGGQPLSRSPETLASGYVMYTSEMSNDWTFTARGDASYTSKIPHYSLPFAYWGARTIFNGYIGLGHGPYNLAFWARNLLNKEYVAAGINQPGVVPPLAFTPVVTLGERRTFGVTFSYTFGEGS